MTKSVTGTEDGEYSSLSNLCSVVGFEIKQLQKSDGTAQFDFILRWTSEERELISWKTSGRSFCNENEHHTTVIAVLILWNYNKRSPNNKARWIKTSLNALV